MARPLRIEYGGAHYHVMNRGNARQRVFRCDGDHELLLDKLGSAVEAFRVSLLAYCLMPNHFHLYLATPEGNLSRFMQSFLTAFTVNLNRRRHSSGHIFQGRFKAVLVEDEAYGQELARYVHLNPVRASQRLDAPLGASCAATDGAATPPSSGLGSARRGWTATLPWPTGRVVAASRPGPTRPLWRKG